MQALRAIVRNLTGSAALAGSATWTGTGPVEVTDAQLDQVAGGGGALGGVIGSAMKDSPVPDGGKGGITGNMG